MLLYAVTSPDAVTPPTVGISGSALEAVRCPDAAVVVEECDRVPDPSVPAAVHFARLLTDLARSETVLPVRFPTAMPSRSDVLAELRRRAPFWQRRLGELDGLVEVVVRASPPEDDVRSPSGSERSGGAYLRHRAAMTRADDDLYADLAGVAGPWCRDLRRLSSSTGVRLALLVPRDAVSQLRRVLDDWSPRRAGGELRVGGPWPPFSFVTDSGRDAP